MATLTPVKIIESGIASSMSTCSTGSGGDDFTNTGIEFVRIQNTHATVAYSIKVQVQTTSIQHPQYGALTKSDTYNAIASPGSSGANSIIIGPFKQGAYNNTNDKTKIFYKTLCTGTTATTFNALSDITGSHLLKIEVLYLEN